VDVLQQILQSSSDLSSIDAPTTRGWTALHYASAFGERETVVALLAAGADPTLRNIDGRTAREECCWAGGSASTKKDIMALLLVQE